MSNPKIRTTAWSAVVVLAGLHVRLSDRFNVAFGTAPVVA